MSPHSEIASTGAGTQALSVAPLGRMPAPGDASGVTDARVRAIVIAVFADSDDERASSQALKKMIRRVLEANQALDVAESSELLPGMSDTADQLVIEVAGRLGCTRSEARRTIAAVNAAQGTAKPPYANGDGQAESAGPDQLERYQ
jgi:hypothetical protein